ncbi:hypothetical protein GGR54DRAFT_636884 [Hypoxylon sp. NC1633]|nr:hypothetical protein GGR54DRAFT_636884 [Hypoxylon sp. NC1633]
MPPPSVPPLEFDMALATPMEMTEPLWTQEEQATVMTPPILPQLPTQQEQQDFLQDNVSPNAFSPQSQVPDGVPKPYLYAMLESYVADRNMKNPPLEFFTDMTASLGPEPKFDTPKYRCWNNRRFAYWESFNRFVADHEMQDNSEMNKMVDLACMMTIFGMIDQIFVYHSMRVAYYFYYNVTFTSIQTKRLYAMIKALQSAGFMLDTGEDWPAHPMETFEKWLDLYLDSHPDELTGT